jgi:3-oxoacyl-[acyl-carrier protein] reductase
MELGLHGKVAIITGAGRGIGEAIALALAREKVNIVIDDINGVAAHQVKEKAIALGSRAMAFDADITKPEDMERMVGEVEKEFGHIDILVNNAVASNSFRRTLFMETDLSEWTNILNVNLTGTFICSKAVAKVMIKNRKGKIINMSSLAANLPAAGFAAYSASKAGIEGLSKTMAGELGQYGISVIYLRPGVIETEITKSFHQGEHGEWMLKPIPLRRFGKPSEIGDLVVFLASEAANYINGGPIPIDGGKFVMQF